MLNRSKEIQKFILNVTPKHPTDLVATTMQHFKVTSTTVHRHINALVKQGKITKSGNTRAAQYFIASDFSMRKNYKIDPELSEDRIFYEEFADIFKRLKPNLYKICSFGVTEMINNAIDHSESVKLEVTTRFEAPYLIIIIKDFGVGAFKKICDYLRISDLREGIIHLTKGKFTTDPSRHSGQGLFFTSRMFDYFSLQANGFSFTRDNIQEDWMFTKSDVTIGTEVRLVLNTESCIDIVNIFAKYQSDDYAFDCTDILVELTKYNEEMLVSRSQAKRILLGLEKFNVVTLDFKKIDFVGQGFIDEIFRVFKNAHPHITINYINACDDVKFMIKRAI
jgi:anti-sigma regulatory factor (Ser/Thr protein kinase)